MMPDWVVNGSAGIDPVSGFGPEPRADRIARQADIVRQLAPLITEKPQKTMLITKAQLLMHNAA